jgi:hypothetical protein
MVKGNPGGVETKWPLCRDEREDRMPMDLLFGTCGRRGRFYENIASGGPRREEKPVTYHAGGIIDQGTLRDVGRGSKT